MSSTKCPQYYTYIISKGGDPYDELVNAIIVQAVHDYASAFCKLWKYDDGCLSQYKQRLEAIQERLLIDPENNELINEKKRLSKLIKIIVDNQGEKREVEHFFLSQWFTLMSKLNGRDFLERLEQKCYDICAAA